MAKTRPYFESVDQKVDFPKLEEKILAAWYKKGAKNGASLVDKYLSKNKNSKKYFSFIDGPITANNPMGVHHAWGRTYKDLWRRYKNMQGFRQLFQNGFDSQGLWVEVEVEKELQFKSKKDIEEFGVAKFVDLCRARVKKYSGIQTEQSKRLGYFMDWENSYYTLSEDNNYMIWNFLKKCHESGWIYKGNDSVPWCPRCETAISQHEMLTEDYKEVTHEAVYLAFKVVGSGNEYFMVWTTTPWTIPANIAIAVDVELDYSLIETTPLRQGSEGARKYWLAREAVERVMGGVKYKVIKIVKGAKLVGLRYTGAFDDLPQVKKVSDKNQDKFHTVIATDDLIMPITTDEGTGLVHTAVSAGSEDFKLGKKLGLPMIPVIDDTACYFDGFGFLSGKNAKKNPELILNYLKTQSEEGKHFYFKIEKYKHRYPACWRCKAELVWKVTDEWYVAMDKPLQKSNIKKTAPLRGQISKMGDWGEGDEEQITVDTRTLRERMKEVAGKINWIPAFGKEREMDWLNNMHDWLISKKNRYWGLALPIWECPKCRNFEVIGSKEELKEKSVEGWDDFAKKSPHKPQIDKVKIKCQKCGHTALRIEPVGNPWLDAGIVPFSTISLNNKAANFDLTKTKPLYLTDREAWKNWFPADFITESFPGQFKNWFYALIAMSTVMEDTNPFKTVLGFATLFDESGRPMHKSSGNMIEFIEGADKIGVDVMRWMYAKQSPADNLLFGYKNADETRRRFHLKLWNTYNFFVTYANLDGWRPFKNSKNQKLQDSKHILDKWFLARLNQTIVSVTDALDRYDAASASGEIEKLVDDFSVWYIRRSRERVGPGAQDEGNRDSFYSTAYFVLCTLSKILAPFTPFLSEVIYMNLTGEDSVHLTNWPDPIKLSQKESLSRKLIAEMELARQIVEKAHAQRKDLKIPVRQPLSKITVFSEKKLDGDIVRLMLDELNIKSCEFKKAKEGLTVELDTKISRELLEEAQARDIIRKIQEERKTLGLSLNQKVDVKIEPFPQNKKLADWIIKKAQIRNFSAGKFKVAKTSK